jgi:hypothetical protein
VETVAPPSIHPATESPLPDPDLSLPVPSVRFKKSTERRPAA